MRDPSFQSVIWHKTHRFSSLVNQQLRAPSADQLDSTTVLAWSRALMERSAPPRWNSTCGSAGSARPGGLLLVNRKASCHRRHLWQARGRQAPHQGVFMHCTWRHATSALLPGPLTYPGRQKNIVYLMAAQSCVLMGPACKASTSGQSSASSQRPLHPPNLLVSAECLCQRKALKLQLYH